MGDNNTPSPGSMFLQGITPPPADDPAENAPETIWEVICGRTRDIEREMPQTWVAAMKIEEMMLVLTTRPSNDKARAIQQLHYEVIRMGSGVHLGFTSAVSYRQLGFITQAQALGLVKLLHTKKNMAMFKSKPVIRKCEELGIIELYAVIGMNSTPRAAEFEEMWKQSRKTDGYSEVWDLLWEDFKKADMVDLRKSKSSKNPPDDDVLFEDYLVPEDEILSEDEIPSDDEGLPEGEIPSAGPTPSKGEIDPAQLRPYDRDTVLKALGNVLRTGKSLQTPRELSAMELARLTYWVDLTNRKGKLSPQEISARDTGRAILVHLGESIATVCFLAFSATAVWRMRKPGRPFLLQLLRGHKRDERLHSPNVHDLAKAYGVYDIIVPEDWEISLAATLAPRYKTGIPYKPVRKPALSEESTQAEIDARIRRMRY